MLEVEEHGLDICAHAFGVLGCDEMGYNKGQGQDIARAEGAWLWQG